MYGSSLQQAASASAAGGGGRASQYQYYSSQSQQPAVSAAQQHLPQYYTGTQVPTHSLSLLLSEMVDLCCKIADYVEKQRLRLICVRLVLYSMCDMYAYASC